MLSHRVFVLWKHPLFLESLRLLLQNVSIQWVGASSFNEDQVAEIQRLQPDTILFEDEENGRNPAELLELLETSPANFRIFRLGMADNELKIYHKETRTVLQAEDLLNLILSSE